MPFPWSSILSLMTDSQNALAIPYTVDIFSTSSVYSYLGPIKNNILKSPNSAYSKFGYPLNGQDPIGIDKPVIKSSILIGFQIQIIANGYNQEQTNPQSLDDFMLSVQGQRFQFRAVGRPLGDISPDTVIYETTVQVISDSEELLQAANLQSQLTTARSQIDVPNNLLVAGNKYTIRSRGILTCPDVVTNFGNQWFLYNASRPFYTGWSSTVFNVNQAPIVANLSTNGQVNPTKIPLGPIYLSFSIIDPDGPQFGYDLQVSSVVPPATFQADMWDTNLVSDSAGTGTRNYSIPYAGPTFTRGKSYYWRVKANDGLTDGAWSAISSFKINSKPRISSLKVNGNELITNSIPYVSNLTPVVTWVFDDSDGDIQKGYTFTYSYAGGQTTTISAVGQGNTLTLPSFTTNKEVTISLKAKDDVEETDVVIGKFITNANPVVSTLRINGSVNPVNLTTSTPTFSWVFQDVDQGDVQQKYRIKASKDINFTDLAWDSGDVSGNTSSVIYPLANLVHSHGTYYVRVSVFDGVSWSLNDSNSFSYFAINNVPTIPLLTYPTSGAYSGTLNVQWTASTDADLDPLTYTLEMTSTRLSNKGWKYLAGPFPQSQINYLLDLSDIPSGDNYGIRITASDGMSESGSSSTDRFSILNHAPNMPVLVMPETASQVSNVLRVGWIEANPRDVDLDSVFYIVELSANSSDPTPTWIVLGNYPEGTTSSIFDISGLPDGIEYKVRIKTIDEHGAAATPVYSGVFIISNQVSATDFERNNGVLYISTSDGRIYETREDIWEYYEDWSDQPKSPPLELYMTSGATLDKVNGELTITSNSSTCLLRHKKLGDRI